jgi:anti-anti-sigma regulatory factor
METQNTTAVEPQTVGSVKPQNVRAKRPTAPKPKTLMAPAFVGPSQSQREWAGLFEHLRADEPLVLDMSNVTSLERPAVAQLISFLQAADRQHSCITMVNIPRETHAMLEILGVHHLVQIDANKASQR